MAGCWVGYVGLLSSCFGQAGGWWRLVALARGLVFPWGVVWDVGDMWGKVRVWGGSLVNMAIVVWVEGHYFLEMGIGAS